MFSSAGDNGGEDEEGKSPLGKSYSNLGIYWRKKEKSSKAQTKREIKKKEKKVCHHARDQETRSKRSVDA